MGRFTLARKAFTSLGDDVLRRIRSTKKAATLADSTIRTSAKGGASKVLRGGSELPNAKVLKQKALLSRVRPSTIAKVGAVTGVGAVGLASFDPQFRRSVGAAIENTSAAKRERAAADRIREESSFITDYLGSGGDVGSVPGLIGGGSEEDEGQGFLGTANSPIGFVALAGITGLGIWAYTKRKKK